jgi:hypothetical protein
MSSDTRQEPEFGDAYAATQMARKQNPLRRIIKSFYVSSVLRHVRGRTVDVGCGAGPILERLPAGSVGIEVNPVLVSQLKAQGLDVRTATPDPTRIDLGAVAGERFQSLVLSHVLEHFDHADKVLRQLLADAAGLGIDTVVIVVPEWVGYQSDATHKTFVTMDYLTKANVLSCEGFRLQHNTRFPSNTSWAGRYFIYNELMLVYRREPATGRAA